MKKNMALLDRFLRLLVAIVLLVIYLKSDLSSTAGYIVLGSALLFALTAIFGTCPIYSLFGIDTRQFKETQRPV